MSNAKYSKSSFWIWLGFSLKYKRKIALLFQLPNLIALKAKDSVVFTAAMHRVDHVVSSRLIVSVFTRYGRRLFFRRHLAAAVLLRVHLHVRFGGDAVATKSVAPTLF